MIFILKLVFSFLSGACVGSFLNVCIWRLPREESLISPSSHCPHCGTFLKAWDNIPLFSFLFLKGKCRYCKKPISIRYFFVELITAALFTIFYYLWGWGLFFAIYTLLACILVVISFIDLKHWIIPDELTIPPLILGIILSAVFPDLHGKQSWIAAFLQSLLGILVGGGFLFFIGWVGEKLFKKEAMGGGDVKLLAMLGAFLGFKHVLMIIFLSALFGSIVGLPLKIKKGQELIPFGPFIALAAIITIILYDKIIRLLGLYIWF